MLRGAGVLCLLAALAVGGSYGWLLWGTGIGTARAQHELREAFSRQLIGSDGGGEVPDPGGESGNGGAMAPAAIAAGAGLLAADLPGKGAPASSPAIGDAVAILQIPRIGVDAVVVEGAGTEELRLGPGHYPSTALPWDDTGAMAIAGHRTTYGQPFWALDELRAGDEITLITQHGTFGYRVTRTIEAAPTDSWVLRETEEPTLVLTTCSPRFSAARRLIVFADRTLSRG